MRRVIAILFILTACGGGEDTTAPKTTAARVDRIWAPGMTDVCANGLCNRSINYVTVDNLTNANVQWDVQISGNGTYPTTGRSAANGEGTFRWGMPQYGMAYITVCPAESTAQERCKSFVVQR